MCIRRLLQVSQACPQQAPLSGITAAHCGTKAFTRDGAGLVLKDSSRCSKALPLRRRAASREEVLPSVKLHLLIASWAAAGPRVATFFGQLTNKLHPAAGGQADQSHDHPWDIPAAQHGRMPYAETHTAASSVDGIVHRNSGAIVAASRPP